MIAFVVMGKAKLMGNYCGGKAGALAFDNNITN
jgi:hypothetical protein